MCVVLGQDNRYFINLKIMQYDNLPIYESALDFCVYAISSDV